MKKEYTFKRIKTNFDEEIYFQSGKILSHSNSTSILCREEQLRAHRELIKVAENEDNEYYRVTRTNIVLMKVQADFCILMDYMVRDYETGKMVSLPEKLMKMHFGVYQQPNKEGTQYRDWIKNSATNVPIGYYIQSVVIGWEAIVQAKEAGMTLDHGAETFNELLVNCKFKKDNYNNGSHRKQYKYLDKNRLQLLIEAIRKIDKNDKE